MCVCVCVFLKHGDNFLTPNRGQSIDPQNTQRWTVCRPSGMYRYAQYHYKQKQIPKRGDPYCDFCFKAAQIGDTSLRQTFLGQPSFQNRKPVDTVVGEPVQQDSAKYEYWKVLSLPSVSLNKEFSNTFVHCFLSLSCATGSATIGFTRSQCKNGYG